MFEIIRIDCELFIGLIIAYKDGNGKPWVLPVVRTVEMQLANDLTLDHEYLPIFGLADFSSAAVKLVLGPDSPAVINNLVRTLNKRLHFLSP